MKTIVLMVSKVFPAYHPRKGEPTNFKEKILSGEKIHTIRGNYDLWKKRIDQVNSGTHQLVLKSWIGRPYYTSQEVVTIFDKNCGLGVQKLEFEFERILEPFVTSNCGYDQHYISTHDLAKNDGLFYPDFSSWFKKGKYSLSKPMAIIHFTGFRY